MIKIDENTYNKMPYEIKKHFSLLPNESKNEVVSGFPSEIDTENASRFFYTAKASKKDRDEGLDAFELKRESDRVRDDGVGGDNPRNRTNQPRKNTHPTVKPIELMQYLVRMVAPKGATILDCFMGSNSTGKAVMFENRERDTNYKFIGIELTDEYLPICEARIEYAINKYEYDIKQEMEKTGQLNLFEFDDEL